MSQEPRRPRLAEALRVPTFSRTPAHEFNYPDDIAEGMELFVWLPCERCGRRAKLHMKREVKPAH